MKFKILLNSRNVVNSTYVCRISVYEYDNNNNAHTPNLTYTRQICNVKRLNMNLYYRKFFDKIYRGRCKYVNN